MGISRMMAVAVLDKRVDLEALIHTHQAGVWRYLRFLGASRTEAEDLTQETFVAVWRSGFEQYSDAATAAYLRTTARSRFLMMLRARGRRPKESDLADVDADWLALTDEGEAWDERVEVLQKCLQPVTGKSREALDLSYRLGLTQAEIAERLEMKPEGVKTMLRRVIEKLRQCMEAKLKWPPQETA
ncbi:MAG: sigma-70 family RNA polymerase sigma factor [Planctomycetes bacterium]|nr:sigma-70 family RNA polymerase sigma factor [Planctomycetota bacterium]